MPKLKASYQIVLLAIGQRHGWGHAAELLDIDSPRTVEAAAQGVDLDRATYERICEGVDNYEGGEE